MVEEITFCETAADQVESEVLTAYETIAGVSLAAGDPVRLFLQSLACVIAQQRSIIDITGRRNLLRYADGDYLDHLGQLTGTVRMSAAAAGVTLRFTLSEARSSITVIPAGTRATPNGTLYFATDAAAEIAAGALSADVAATCETAGVAGNDYLAGQITRLVDLVSYVASVSNTGVSSGGADVESDDSFRDRIFTSPEKYSCAGPSGAYEHLALSAHQDIADVAVWSPAAGQVHIAVLLEDGALPEQEHLDLVEAAVSGDEVRPLTDQVTVQAPEQVSYDIDAVWYLAKSAKASLTEIADAVDAALDEYQAWQGEKLGRDINPSALIQRVMDAGAKRVSVTSPAFTVVPASSVAVAGTVGLSYGGMEDD